MPQRYSRPDQQTIDSTLRARINHVWQFYLYAPG